MARLLAGVALSLFALATLATTACGSDTADEKSVGISEPYYFIRTPPTTPPETPDPPLRLEPHRGIVMRSVRLHAIYIGTPGEDAAPRFEPFITWLFGSSAWGVLGEYGVGPGILVDSAYVPREEFFVGTSAPDDACTADEFEELARRFMRRSAFGADDPKDGREAQLVAGAEAYVFFLPSDVRVTMGDKGSYTYSTCIDVLGYHRFNGREPYAVIGGCDEARSGFIVAHELAELATDPIIGQGFFSSEDSPRNGGEVADLCKIRGPVTVDGWSTARYWSNTRGRCLPE